MKPNKKLKHKSNKRLKHVKQKVFLQRLWDCLCFTKRSPVLKKYSSLPCSLDYKLQEETNSEYIEILAVEEIEE